MGYANEVGEALENYLPDWGLPASYCVAATYVMFDTLDKGQKAFDAAPKEERFEESLKASKELIEKATQSMKKMLMFMTNCKHCLIECDYETS